MTTPPGTTVDVPLPAGPKLIQPGVTIGGLLVGGLTGAEARELVEKRFDEPVTLVAPDRRGSSRPSELGASPWVSKAVKTAVRVVRAGLRGAAPRRRLEARSSSGSSPGSRSRPTASRSTRRSKLRNLQPVAKKSAPGRRLKQVVAFQKLSLAIRKHERSLHAAVRGAPSRR